MTWGLDVKSITPTSEDSQVAELLKMSEQDIALAFRVPLAVLGVGNNSYNSTEMLMQSWISSGLGFALNHIEEAFDRLFDLEGYPVEYLELDTDALLRSAFKEYIDGLVRGTQGGIFSPDEARAKVSLPPAPGGHGKEPRVQQQVVPLSYGSEMKPPPVNPPPAPAPSNSDDDSEGEDENDGEKFFNDSLEEVKYRIYKHAGLY
jgi:phage portal protein BeeE